MKAAPGGGCNFPPEVCFLSCRLAPAVRAHGARIKSGLCEFQAEVSTRGTWVCRAEKGCHVSSADCRSRGRSLARPPAAGTPSFPKARAELSVGRVQSCSDTEKPQLLWNKRGGFSPRGFCKASEPTQLSWVAAAWTPKGLENNGKSVV